MVLFAVFQIWRETNQEVYSHCAIAAVTDFKNSVITKNIFINSARLHVFIFHPNWMIVKANENHDLKGLWQIYISFWKINIKLFSYNHAYPTVQQQYPHISTYLLNRNDKCFVAFHNTASIGIIRYSKWHRVKKRRYIALRAGFSINHSNGTVAVRSYKQYNQIMQVSSTGLAAKFSEYTYAWNAEPSLFERRKILLERSFYNSALNCELICGHRTIGNMTPI